MADKKATAASKKKKKNRSVVEGIAYIKATFNNAIISITDMAGNVLCYRSAGMAGYKGSRKGTPFAAQLAADAAAKKAIEEFDMARVLVKVNGPGAGRDSAIRSLRNAGLQIVSLQDITKLPHNGCRPRKKRRV